MSTMNDINKLIADHQQQVVAFMRDPNNPKYTSGDSSEPIITFSPGTIEIVNDIFEAMKNAKTLEEKQILLAQLEELVVSVGLDGSGSDRYRNLDSYKNLVNNPDFADGMLRPPTNAQKIDDIGNMRLDSAATSSALSVLPQYLEFNDQGMPVDITGQPLDASSSTLEALSGAQLSALSDIAILNEGMVLTQEDIFDGEGIILSALDGQHIASMVGQNIQVLDTILEQVQSQHEPLTVQDAHAELSNNNSVAAFSMAPS